jgi:hypothetical protein
MSGVGFSGVLGGSVNPTPTFGPPRRLQHNALLPRLTCDLISPDDRLILSFVLEYLQAQEAAEVLRNVSLHVSGGYVRDLLLGWPSGDLDLALCLRDCDEGVTVDTVVAAMPAFAARRPELAVEAVEIVTALSDAARSKTVDAAAVRMRIGDEWRLVDIMPTIGEELYDESNRIPQRDGRGTAEQDTLRRDLTIGAMLLRVDRSEQTPSLLDAQGELAEQLKRRLAKKGVSGIAWRRGWGKGQRRGLWTSLTHILSVCSASCVRPPPPLLPPPPPCPTSARRTPRAPPFPHRPRRFLPLPKKNRSGNQTTSGRG